MTTTTTHRLKGVNDEADTCALCGKTNLKRVAWLAELDEDGNDLEVAPYGTDCAGKLLYGRKTAKNGELTRRHGEAMEAARRWIAAGHTADEVARGIWDRFGYSVEARDGGIRFRFNGIDTLVR